MSQGGFLSLRRRVKARCSIELLEPLHVGAGKDPTSPIDLPILKNPSGTPVIPGSSLKGLFRSYLGRILYAYKMAGGSEIRMDGIEIKLEPCVDSLIEDEDKKNAIKLEETCLLDRLFGYAGRKFSLASPLRVTDALPSTEPGTVVRTHVQIDRVRDAAARGMLVNVEAVNESRNGAVFEFTMVFDELEDEAFKYSNNAFYLLLKMLERGEEFFIGGWKSRGYGLAKVSLKELEVADLNDLISGNWRSASLIDLLDGDQGEVSK